MKAFRKFVPSTILALCTCHTDTMPQYQKLWGIPTRRCLFLNGTELAE
jgi:hypothetical protein